MTQTCIYSFRLSRIWSCTLKLSLHTPFHWCLHQWCKHQWNGVMTALKAVFTWLIVLFQWSSCRACPTTHLLVDGSWASMRIGRHVKATLHVKLSLHHFIDVYIDGVKIDVYRCLHWRAASGKRETRRKPYSCRGKLPLTGLAWHAQLPIHQRMAIWQAGQLEQSVVSISHLTL